MVRAGEWNFRQQSLPLPITQATPEPRSCTRGLQLRSSILRQTSEEETLNVVDRSIVGAPVQRFRDEPHVNAWQSWTVALEDVFDDTNLNGLVIHGRLD